MNGLAFMARLKTVEDQNGNLVNDIDEIIVPNEAINTGELARLRQTIQSKLTAVVSKPMWIWSRPCFLDLGKRNSLNVV